MNVCATGVHHITLRVSNMERSRAFFQEVLGFAVERPEPHRYRFWVGDTRIVLKPPLEGTPSDDQFSEYRVGPDHIALAVEDRGELEKAVETLREAGVNTQGIQLEPSLGKEFVCFRDPDNVQWEFFTK
ncbi:MAG TPA: VOC family protein [Dehalococcoidia bacterium]|nr:VOC family protein [Dehalococcoidia bacterium]